MLPTILTMFVIGAGLSSFINIEIMFIIKLTICTTSSIVPVVIKDIFSAFGECFVIPSIAAGAME